MSGSGKQNHKPSSSVGSSEGGAVGSLRDLFAASQAAVSGGSGSFITIGDNDAQPGSKDASRSQPVRAAQAPGYLSNAEGNQAAVSGPGPGSGSYSTGDMLAQSGFDVNRSLSMRGVQIVPGYVTNAEESDIASNDNDEEAPRQCLAEEFLAVTFPEARSISYSGPQSGLSAHKFVRKCVRTDTAGFDNGNKAGHIAVLRIPSISALNKRSGELSPLARSSLEDDANVPRFTDMAEAPADSTLEVLSSVADLSEPQQIPASSRPLQSSISTRDIGKTPAAEDVEEDALAPRSFKRGLMKLRSLPLERRAGHEAAGGDSTFQHHSDTTPAFVPESDDHVRDGIYNVATLISPPQRRRQTQRASGELMRVYRPGTGSFITSPSPPSAIPPSRALTMRRPAGSSASFSGIPRPQFKRSGSSTSNGTSRRFPPSSRRLTIHAPPLHRATTMPDIHHLLTKPRVSRAESTGSRFGQPGIQQPTPAPQKLGKIARKTVHYLSLVVAEHPVEKHRQFQQQLQRHRRSSNPPDVELGAEWGQSTFSAALQGYQPEESEALMASKNEFESIYHSSGSWLDSSNHVLQAAMREQRRTSNSHLSQTYSEFIAEVEIPLARLRWLNAIQTIISSRELVYYANIMANKSLPGDDRFYAVVQLECMLTGYSSPCKRRVVNVLTNTARRKKMSHAEKLKLEIVITGERMLEFFTPATMHKHRPYFSYTYSVVVITIFFYMAGEYTLQQYRMKGAVDEYGPRSLLSWILSVWDTNGDKVFDVQYLHLWGSRYAPDLQNGEFYRWFSSVAVHRSFGHLFANVLLTLSMSLNLEVKYGAWRIALVWFMSCLGGQFLSATTEDPCSHVVGASGGVFGMIGLFVADMLVNFQTINRPLLRCLLIFGICMTFVGRLIAQNDNDRVISHLSHVGGLVCGLFLSFLFLPKLRKGRHHIVLSVSGMAAFLGFFAVLPAYLYLFRFPRVACPAIISYSFIDVSEHPM